jgi:hypothetical protein
MPGPFSLAKSHGQSEENVCPMLPKTSTLPLSEGDILHHAKLVSGAPRVFITPCQVSMTKEKDYAWAILLSQVSMAILGECLPDATHLSIALDRGLVRMSTICSSVDMYWSFIAPFCTMSRMKSCKKLLEATLLHYLRHWLRYTPSLLY